MTGTQITVEGADAFRSSLADASHGLEQLDAAEAEAGRIVQLRASGLAPKLSGALSRSIRADASGDGVSVSADMPYAVFPEFGTSRMSAHPYMRPALEESQEQVVAAYARQAQAELGKVHGT